MISRSKLSSFLSIRGSFRSAQLLPLAKTLTSRFGECVTRQRVSCDPTHRIEVDGRRSFGCALLRPPNLQLHCLSAVLSGHRRPRLFRTPMPQ